MKNLNERKRRPSPEFEIDTLLERYFDQLLQWGRILTRGDEGITEEIVQDLCLQLTLASPDLSNVANLDGYLYTCLKNMYVSSLARASRERLRVVCLEDFDSVEMALSTNTSGDLLDKQNELLRICTYTLWRKDTSKSASYLILHFFHGYHRSEVAAIARLPIAAIYSKLKDARAEVREHLQGSGKLRVISKNSPPEPKLLLSPLSSAELFSEVRISIFNAKTSICLSEKELLSHYQDQRIIPIPVALLSHIVSCERCLRILDTFSQRPNSEDRGPLDDYESPRKPEVKNRPAAFGPMMQAVRRRREQVREHRPGLLAIAVDGKIVAFHDVQGQHSSLSSRIENSSAMQFVEVFSEQQVRLAQLFIEERPPIGDHVQTQRILLSDRRWLELTIRFDGLGTHAEANYFDPALAANISPMEEHESALAFTPNLPLENSTKPIAQRINDWCRNFIVRAMPTPVFAGVAALLCLTAIGGYIAYRHATPSFNSVLERAAVVESIDPSTETEHQIVRIEEVSAGGSTIPRGTTELWQDGNGKRYMRRLYNMQNQLLASESQSESGQRFTTVAQPLTTLSPNDRRLIEDGLWKRDISSRTFQTASAKHAQVTATSTGFEITSTDPNPADTGILSQTLVLNHQYQLVEERLSIRRGASVEQVRFVQTVYRKERRTSVPDSIFHPVHDSSFNRNETPLPLSDNRFSNTVLPGESSTQLSQLHIAVLFELNKLGADVADPIAVIRTPEGRIRVTGFIANEQRLAQIKTSLDTLPDHNLIENLLTSSATDASKRSRIMDLAKAPTRIDATQIGESASKEALRQHFQTTGLSGLALDAAIAHFTDDALQHAQRALQSAYALDRLASVLAQAPPGSLDAASRQRWAAMAAKHTDAVETNLQALKSQLSVISTAPHEMIDAEDTQASIDNPAEFMLAAKKLRKNVQAINVQVGEIFTGTTSESKPSNLQQMLSTTIRILPLKAALQIGSFAAELSNSEHLAASNATRK